MGGHLLQRTGRTGLGGTRSPAQGVFGASCQANGGPSPSENRAHQPGGDRESCPGGVRSLLQGQWGGIFFIEPGAPAWGGQGVLPRGCSEPPARPMGGHLFQRTGRTGPGGTGNPAQGCSEPPARPTGGHFLQRTGRTGLGGTGSPAKGVFGASCKANGGPSLSENRAHRPRGDRESCPGGVRSLLPGQWGAISFREPGTPAWGGQGVLPRGCSEPPARPMGGHLLHRTGRTGLGGTRSPAQGVFGASCQANGGPSLSENRAHRPGGDGEPCPGVFRASCKANGGPFSSENRAHRPGGDRQSCQGGVRSLLPGQWGAIFVREPGAPARGGQGVLPRGCSEPPARPMGGHLLQRTGRTGPGGTGSPAQGVFGASCKADGGGTVSREPGAPAWGGREVLPRGCSEPPARPVGSHLPVKPLTPSPTTPGSKVVGQQYRGS